MPDLTGVTALDVAIGLFFMYAVLSVVASAINEAIATRLRWRAKDLERGLRKLLGEEDTKTFYEQPRVAALKDPKGRPPSYLPPRTFALTLLDTFAPPEQGQSRDLIADAGRTVATIQNPTVKAIVEDALLDARGDVDRFRETLERSFDDVMNRVSGWYKRRVQLVLFLIGLALVCAANADTFSVGERLWKDDAVRAAVVAEAARGEERTTCPDADAGDDDPLDRAAECVDGIQELGLPLGWTKDTIPDESASNEPFRFVMSWLGKLLGLLITALAISMGAPFWFDLIGRIARLRGSGPAEPPGSKDDRPDGAGPTNAANR